MSRREFEEHLHQALEVFRALFDGSRVARSIDSIYEEELKRALIIIPEDSIEAVCHGIQIFKAVYDSLAFDSLNTKLSELGFDIKLDLNLYKIAISIVKEKIEDARMKNGIISLIKKCKPVIDCFSLALKDPSKYVSKLAMASGHEYDGIL